MDKKLFVYGTLKRGNSLWHTYRLDLRAKFICEDSVKGELYDLGWFPAMFEKGKHVKNVPGEVFLVPEEIYNSIREMEEHAGYETKTVKTRKGHSVDVFFYKHESARIPSNRIDEF